MRIFAAAILFAAGLAGAAPDAYDDVRDLSLNAEGLNGLEVEAGAGGMSITGVAGTDTVVVEALIGVQGEDADRAREIIESDLVLTLEREGDRAVLKAYFKSGWLRNYDAGVRLEITVPETMSLDIEDGSGAIIIRNVVGDIAVDDGSGSIDMVQVGGNVTIDDGSGSISARNVGGDISIVDGSGSLTVQEVEGSVTIDDGSGGITVSGVANDVNIREAGSGSLRVTDVQGRFETGT
jgi:hypothetical protein